VVVLTNTKGDVEGHRVCDKHIIRWRSHHPQWPWWTFQHAGYCPSSSWSRRINPHIWEDDTTLTAYLPSSGCRIVQRNRCPPNHPVVGMTSGISENMLTAYLPLAWRMTRCTRSRRVRRQGESGCRFIQGIPLRCTNPRWWAISQLRRLLPWRMSN